MALYSALQVERLCVIVWGTLPENPLEEGKSKHISRNSILTLSPLSGDIGVVGGKAIVSHSLDQSVHVRDLSSLLHELRLRLINNILRDLLGEADDDGLEAVSGQDAGGDCKGSEDR